MSHAIFHLTHDGDSHGDVNPFQNVFRISPVEIMGMGSIREKAVATANSGQGSSWPLALLVRYF